MAWTWGKTGTIAGAIAGMFAVYQGLDSYDLRPAGVWEVNRLAGVVYEDKLTRAEARFWELDWQRQKFLKAGRLPPKDLIKQWQWWRNEVERLRRLLNKVR